MVSYGASTHLVRITVDTLEPDESSIIDSTCITGSINYNRAREMSELFSPGPHV